MPEDFGGGDEIAFEHRGAVGLVRLTRAKALNALTHNMVRALRRALTAWEDDPSVACIVVEGEGRAFCAGGDLMAVYRGRGTGAPPFDFFADEYRLNTHIRRYAKPYVSFLDGIVMGGGVGISVHGSCRIVTDNTLLAMPETGIGFFPDVGGSAFLPHLPGAFGTYLALTGARARQGDCLATGIATHAVAASDLPAILDRLAGTGSVDAAVEGHLTEPAPETPPATRSLIEDCYAAPTLDGVIAALERRKAEGDETAADMLAALEGRSPTSLAVTLRQMRDGAALDMEDCMRMEYRILRRMLEGHDLYEGIRAVLIDKGDTPQWWPATVADIDPADIEAYFAPLGERELDLP